MSETIMESQENYYNRLLDKGLTPEEARNKLAKVSYNHESETLYIDNIRLVDEGDWVNMRYNVRADTELRDPDTGEEIFEPGVLYQTNGRTTFVPDINARKKIKADFYVPSARVDSVDIEVDKEWIGFTEDDKFDVQFDLKRNGDFFNKEEEPYVITKDTETGEWKLRIENLIRFDSKGRDYVFEVLERTDTGANYVVKVNETTSTIISPDPNTKYFKITK